MWWRVACEWTSKQIFAIAKIIPATGPYLLLSYTQKHKHKIYNISCKTNSYNGFNVRTLLEDLSVTVDQIQYIVITIQDTTIPCLPMGTNQVTWSWYCIYSPLTLSLVVHPRVQFIEFKLVFITDLIGFRCILGAGNWWVSVVFQWLCFAHTGF